MPLHQQSRSSQPNAATPSVAERKRAYAPVGLALILLATCVAYYPAMSGSPLWDDDAHLTKSELQSAAGLYRIWFEPGATQQYYPLLHSAFWLEHKLWGNSVGGYHAITLLWHLISVSLVYLILTKLKIPGALLAAAIFALHPVMVESVAWITEQKNTLSAVFYLGAMLTYLRFDESRSPPFYFIALGLFIFGLLTKTVTATLPAALLVIFWWQRATISWKRDVLPLVPFFLLGAAAGLVTAWVERYLIGAEGAEFTLTFAQRVLIAGRVIWFYAAKLVWPTNLMFFYPRWIVDPSVQWQWLFPAAALGTTIVLWAFRHKSRGPLAAWLFFVGTLFPVLGFLNVYPFIYSYVADHFQYLASLGLIVLAAAAITRGLSTLTPAGSPLAVVSCCVLIAALAMLTRSQSQMYADSLTLYQSALVRNPDSWLAHFNIAWELGEAGQSAEAVEHYRCAIVLRPDYAEGYNNLGRLFLNTGRLPEAIEQFHQALAHKPDNAAALNNLGAALDRQGKYSEAVEPLQRAIRLDPNLAHAYQNLGNALMGLGQLRQAIEQFDHALRLTPNDAEAQNNMAIALVESGKLPQAIEHFRRAIELNPQDPKAYANLGKTLMDAGNDQEAAAQLQIALQLQPDRADLHNCLGKISQKGGRTDEAIAHFLTSLRLDPNLAETYPDLAASLALVNRRREAIATAERGIDVARSTGQQEAAIALEEWLKKYRVDPTQSGSKTP